MYLLLTLRIVFHKYKRGKDFINPLAVFLIFFAVTFFGLPSIQILTQSFRYTENYTNEAYFYAAIYLNTFITCVIATYVIVVRKKKCKDVKEIFDVNNWKEVGKVSKITIFCLIVLPCILVIPYFYKYINDLGYSTYLANRIILLSGKGYFTTILMGLIPYFVYGVVELYHKTKKYNKRPPKVHIIFLLLVAIIPGIVLGSRTNILLPFGFVMLSYVHLKNKGAFPKRRELFNLAISIGILLIVALWLQDYRQTLMGAIKTEKSPFIITLAGGFGTAENLFWWFDNAREKLFYGSTLLPIFVGYIPRSLWPNKPFGGGPALVNTIRPGAYNQGASNISSYTTGFPFEFMMNFGFIGSIIGGIIFGIVLAFVFLYKDKIRNAIQYVIWIITLYCVISYLHGEVFGVTGKFIALVLPLILADKMGELTGREEQLIWKMKRIKRS